MEKNKTLEVKETLPAGTSLLTYKTYCIFSYTLWLGLFFTRQGSLVDIGSHSNDVATSTCVFCYTTAVQSCGFQ